MSEQSLYNLTPRTVELEVLPACERYGVGVIPWSPLGGGLLGGVLADRAAGGRRGGTQASRPGSRHCARSSRQWEKLCAELGEEPADVALAWLLHNPVVTAPIIGPRTLEQLDGALRRARRAARRRRRSPALDEIFPGPGGPAPEAYAW